MCLTYACGAPPLEPSDALIVGAEISFGLVGMAGIIASLRGKEIRRSEVVGLTVIVYSTFAVGFTCLVPMLLMLLDLTETQVWSVTSAIISLTLSVGLAFGVFGIRRTKHFRENRLSHVFMWITAVALIFLNIANATGYFFEPSFAPVFGSGILTLALSAYFFGMNLLVPAWRVVIERQKETASKQDT